MPAAPTASRPAGLQAADGSVKPLPSKVPYHKAKAGDRFIAIGPSGGGYGDPRKRAPEAVLSDVLDGYVSAQAAQSDYAVALRDTTVDLAQTAALRET